MGLNDRKYRSHYKDVSTGVESFAPDTGTGPAEFAVGVAGKYTSSTPSPSNGEWTFLRVDSDGKLLTTASISGDVNVDNTSLSTTGLIGKASGTNADFTTAYGTGNAITCTGLPDKISQITDDDIVSIQQIATDGSVTNTYTRDDITLVATGTGTTTLTITGATFVNTDSFVVTTNIERMVTGTGNATINGTQRVVLCADDPAVTSLAIIDDWDESDRCKVNPIVGQAGVQAGTGNATVTTQRVVIAQDDTVATDLTAIKTAVEILDNVVDGTKARVNIMSGTGVATATNTAVSVGVASTTILAANANRKFAIFVNDSTSIQYLALGGTATANSGIRLNPTGGSFEINATNLYTGIITGITTGTGVITVVEG